MPVFAEIKAGDYKNTIRRKLYFVPFAANCMISIVI